MLVLDLVRLRQAGGAVRDGVLVRGARVRHLDGEVDDAVAVLGDVVGDGSVPARTAPVKTNRARPDSSTYAAWSRLPVSGPQYATQRMPNAVE